MTEQNKKTAFYDSKFNEFLRERFIIERDRHDRSGVYAYTQKLMAYNSNKIEGSTLTKEHTESLFSEGIIVPSDDYYRAKDVEEMQGHFLMFNRMLDTLEGKLSQDIIKKFHYELKSGVFEDRANGYAIGDYKKRPNMVGGVATTLPGDVEPEMVKLLSWYEMQEKTLHAMAQFHACYESIHPFQDGNGRTGRMILFRECLIYDLIPVVIEDTNRQEYLAGLREYRESRNITKLVQLFCKEQEVYKEACDYFWAG